MECRSSSAALKFQPKFELIESELKPHGIIKQVASRAACARLQDAKIQ
jgi:hypothetical protein